MELQICPLRLDSLIQEVQVKMDELSAQELDKEVMPILNKVMGTNTYDKHSEKLLFDWLVDPKHTVEEFNYVLGPLG